MLEKHYLRSAIDDSLSCFGKIVLPFSVYMEYTVHHYTHEVMNVIQAWLEMIGA